MIFMIFYDFCFCDNKSSLSVLLLIRLVVLNQLSMRKCVFSRGSVLKYSHVELFLFFHFKSVCFSRNFASIMDILIAENVVRWNFPSRKMANLKNQNFPKIEFICKVKNVAFFHHSLFTIFHWHLNSIFVDILLFDYFKVLYHTLSFEVKRRWNQKYI